MSGWAICAELAANNGQQLRSWRQAHGYPLATLAGMWGTDAANLSRIERGQAVPSGPLLGVIERTLQSPFRPQTGSAAQYPPIARLSDPVSSQHAVADMAADISTRELIEATIAIQVTWFSDSDLVRDLARQGTPKPRNIVARYRGWIEEAGTIHRVGVLHSPRWNRKLMHFKLVY